MINPFAPKKYPYPSSKRPYTVAFCDSCQRQRTFTGNRCDVCHSLFDWTALIWAKRAKERDEIRKARAAALHGQQVLF